MQLYLHCILHSPKCYCCCCPCSVTKLCPTLCDPMDYSTPGFPDLHHLPELAQICVHWVGDAIQPSHPLTRFSSCPQSFPASRSFPESRLLASGGQSIGASASVSVLAMNIQSWFPLGLTGLISMQAVQGTLKSLLWHHNLNQVGEIINKHSLLWVR